MWLVGISLMNRKKVHIFRTGTITTKEPFLLWISKQVQAQLKSAYYLIKLSKKIDIAFFFGEF